MKIDTTIEFRGVGKTTKKKMFTFSKLAFLTVLAVLVALLPCTVQGVQKQAPSVSQNQGPTDPEELALFLDPIFAKRRCRLSSKIDPCFSLNFDPPCDLSIVLKCPFFHVPKIV